MALDPLPMGMVIFSILTLVLATAGLLTFARGVRMGLWASITATVFYWFHLQGKIDHNMHIWVFAGFFLCWAEAGRTRMDGRNLLILRLIQTTLLAQYFMSGLWKVRSIFSSATGSEFLSQAHEQVVSAVAQGNMIAPPVLEFLSWPRADILVSIGYVGVLLFQLSCVVPIFTGRFWMYWGFAATLFHLTTGFFMGIWFRETIAGALVFLILAEAWVREKAVSGSSENRTLHNS